MRLTKINNFKYKVNNDGLIYVENDQLYFTIKTKQLMEIIYKFLKKIKDHIKGDYLYYRGDDAFLNDQFPKINDEVVIYLRPYIYNVKNEYLNDKQIDQLFSKRGNWQKGEGHYVDLLYLQGDSHFFNRKYWSVESFIFNKAVRDSLKITKKDKQHQLLAPSFRENILPPQIYFELTPKTTADFAKDFIEKHQVVIMKPPDGHAGKGIKIITKLGELEKEIKSLKRIKRADNWSNKKKIGNISNLHWVLEKYIIDPHLYKGKKYHFRVFYIHSMTGKSFIYKRFRLAIAEQDYQPYDFDNKDIHDTHFVVKEDIKVIYLDEILKKKEYQKILEEVIILFGNISSNLELKCYKENINCFEIFAADLMLEKDLSVKLLEINTNPGFSFNKKIPICYEILENCLYHIVDDILPPLNKPEKDPGCFLPVYLKQERNPQGKISMRDFNFIDELSKAWHSEGYGPKSKRDKTGGYYLTCKEGDINKNDFHIHVVGPNGKIHVNSWSRKIKERRKWEELDFRLTPKEQAYHIYVKSGYLKHQNCLDYYKKYNKKK